MTRSLNVSAAHGASSGMPVGAGEVLPVGTRGQGSAPAAVDLPVARDIDLERARRIMREVADDAMDAAEDRLDVLLGGPTAGAR
jgi:hypothetical protein